MINNDHPLWLELRGTIEHAMLNRPRNLQRVIGPSGVGTECVRCLGHMLAQTEKRQSADWLPFVGVAMHAQLEEIFAATVHRPEERVSVGEIGDLTVDGSSDLYVGDPWFTVVDWKVVGENTLKSVRAGGASLQYRVQDQLYGRGWRRAGFRVEHVAVCYLPRNKNSLSSTQFWIELYDEQIALDALARADAIAAAGAALGWDVLLPKLARRPGCLDCSRYPTYTSDPKPGLDDVIAL